MFAVVPELNERVILTPHVGDLLVVDFVIFWNIKPKIGQILKFSQFLGPKLKN
jgi:hypothetical protein